MILGGGASGTMAGIQAARMGANTLIVEEGPWLGGMLSAAGVSAIDGNYQLHSGLWQEFRQKLEQHYGGQDSLKTGWVSHVMYEPQLGARLLKEMAAAEAQLLLRMETSWKEIRKHDEGWEVTLIKGGQEELLRTRVLIDGTELGDVAKAVGVPYDIGMDGRNDTGEEIAPAQANDIIQDLTYVAILKDYGVGEDKTIPRPPGYDPSPFRCSCAGFCDPDSLSRTLWDCDKMLSYGKLPGPYYMINWPIYGNDFYVNVIELSPSERDSALALAKNYTLQFVYYIQTELGYQHLGIADDVFPTEDGLPLIAYHRESRRIHGLVQFNVNHVAQPFFQKQALYRTSIAVGDYPVDHHHAAYPAADNLPDLHFYPVPSYGLPLGCLIPETVDHFIVAEKSISVSNLVNGTTRLQPVTMLLGQAAGALAALAAQYQQSPQQVSVRAVQEALLASKAYLLPYLDVPREHPAFRSLQKLGVCGILRGEGKNVGWSNQTLIYPDSLVSYRALQEGLQDWISIGALQGGAADPSLEEILLLLRRMGETYAHPIGDLDKMSLMQAARRVCEEGGMKLGPPTQPISRAQFAVLVDGLLDPFHLREVGFQGQWLKPQPDLP
ncbi:MAG: FAD-dependent oxidoreductase [Bacteroidota bacterium]